MLQDFPHLSFEKRWEITPEIAYLLGECEGFINALKKIPLLPETHRQLLQISLRRGALSTTAIEGNTLTDEDLESIYAQSTSIPESKQYMKIEVDNVLDAMNDIFTDIASGNEAVITTALIQNLHRSITKNLGVYADCIPGRFREDSRHVGPYRPPDHRLVADLVERLCQWMRSEFSYPSYRTPYDPIVQAIVAHVYLEWIHPFGDGNGRTGRLLEFYILCRADIPLIACTLLSNHYNETRTAYYSAFEFARRSNDLTSFISYAVRGLRDGLLKTFEEVHNSVVRLTWRQHIHDSFHDHRGHKEVLKRRRSLALAMELNVRYTLDNLKLLVPEYIGAYYTQERLAARDVNELVRIQVIRQHGDTYSTNHEEVLFHKLPASKTQ